MRGQLFHCPRPGLRKLSNLGAELRLVAKNLTANLAKDADGDKTRMAVETDTVRAHDGSNVRPAVCQSGRGIHALTLCGRPLAKPSVTGSGSHRTRCAGYNTAIGD